ncbi:polar amino acid ABC transporter, inner membrane subunit [Thalassoporum mexicanum PCC 7367]|uniref:ABC transporter permease subunit n=1 Tax=Thalassoporum mexicanum TaxID=3457544 RepID=UPI00029FABF4|nr:ABC transporter permease subunit [Pseudanabaena sp. PCC 7367]AFY71273.1 polar amino acid ABC transporter, inner membrane subunit [Pseudanabaena sp. PCC 7367]
MRQKFKISWLPLILGGWLTICCGLPNIAIAAETSASEASEAIAQFQPPTAPTQTLIFATEPAFPPFEFKAANGDLVGFDIDLVNAVATAANFQVEFQSLPFDGLIPALQAKTIDAAVSAITITADRLQSVSFSRPYFKAGLAIATRSENTDIASLSDLEGKKIAVQIGTTGAYTAAAITNAEVRTFDSAPLALQELANRNVDAVINDAPVTLYAIKNNGLQGIKVVDQLLTEEFYGLAIAKNSDYLELINQGLATIFANGTYDQIYRDWFDGQPAELPEVVPIAATESEHSLPFGRSLTVIVTALPQLIKGTWITLKLTVVALLGGMVLGSLLGIARLSRLGLTRGVARIYIDLFRGTPLLVQLFMIYFGLPALAQEIGLEFNLSRLAAGIIALSLNSAAYIAEIVRAGIQSIDKGQSEAARSLGLSSPRTMQLIIFPQAIQRMLPPLGNEFITLLKDTSLVAVIGLEELFREGQLIVAQNYRSFEIYAAVGVIYLILTVIASQGFSWLEILINPTRKFSRRKPNPTNLELN